MFFNTIKAICISLLLIALIHYLYAFFKDTLTVPKIKDLVNKPAKRYDEMYDIMDNNKIQDQTMQGQTMQGQGQINMQGQSMQGQSMQDELKNFLNELKKPDETTFKNKNNDFPNKNNDFQNKNNDFQIKNNDFPSANDMMSGSYTPF